VATLEPGSEFGEYRIEHRLARGGMGVVYKATRMRTGQSIALKCIAPERAAERDYRERFVREAQVLVGLQHPRIVPLIDWGEVDGVLYLALGYLDGPNLEVLIERDGPLTLARTVELLGPVAEALDAAHRRGYIHRDVKPANVMLDRDGNVYLTDFGLGKLAGSSGLSQTGSAIGTLAYMSPEQFTGKVNPALASRIDIYALGCVFHACLTRQEVVPTDSYARAMHAVVHEPPPMLSSIRPSLPRELDAVEARALAKDPAERFETASGLIAAARSVLLAHPEPVPGAVVPPPPRQAERLAIADVADLARVPTAPVDSLGTERVPDARDEAGARPIDVRPIADPAPSRSRPAARGRPRGAGAPWVVLGAAIAGGLAVMALASALLSAGTGSVPPSSQFAAGLTPSPTAVASRHILIPVSPTAPSPTPPPTPTPFPGASDDPSPVAGSWPTDDATVKAWIPAAVRSTCSTADQLQYGASAEWICKSEGLAGFAGQSILLAYLFFPTEADARLGYEKVLSEVGVGYGGGGTCPESGSESGWHRGDGGARLGRVFCTVADGEAQLYVTYFGQPVVVILYRAGTDITALDTAWRENGSARDPAARR
jgi:serine/threonine-protein kinase